jgi:hypothetical protein
VVLFKVLAVVVLLGAVAVLVVVVLLQPRAPYVAVRAASLYALVYGQTGALDDVQVTVQVEARNGNTHSATYFSRLECRLAFAGVTLAVLRAYPFRVPARGVLPLAYVAHAQGAPAGRRRQRRHGDRAPRRRGAIPGGGRGPDAMEGRGDRQRRPVDAPGVPAPLLLAQRHRAPLQM